jgi:hypothetical protein
MVNEEKAPSRSFLGRGIREIIVGVLIAIVVAGLAAAWPTIQALVFPDVISGDYVLLGPEEKPGHGLEVIYLHFYSYDGRVWGSMSQNSKRWSVAGYWKNSYLAFSYRSNGNGLDSVGIGQQLFTPVSAGEDSVLVGDMRGYYCLADCSDNSEVKRPEILQCPNVLIKGGPERLPEAMKKYAAFLGTVQQCSPADIESKTAKK